MIDKNKLIEVMAKAMQKDFPVVNTGVDDDGVWRVKPLELALFERMAEVALQALCKELPEREMRKNYGPYLRGTAEIYDQLKELGK